MNINQIDQIYTREIRLLAVNNWPFFARLARTIGNIFERATSDEELFRQIRQIYTINIRLLPITFSAHLVRKIDNVFEQANSDEEFCRQIRQIYTRNSDK